MQSSVVSASVGYIRYVITLRGPCVLSQVKLGKEKLKVSQEFCYPGDKVCAGDGCDLLQSDAAKLHWGISSAACITTLLTHIECTHIF